VPNKTIMYILIERTVFHYIHQEVLRSVVFVGVFVGSFVNIALGPNISKTVGDEA